MLPPSAMPEEVVVRIKTVVIGGIPHTIQVDGDEPEPERDAAGTAKFAKPQNKAVTPENKRGRKQRNDDSSDSDAG